MVRIKAVLLRSESWTVVMISHALRLHESTIIRHLNDYREGKLGLASVGYTGHLSDSETQSLIAHLDAHTYHHVYEVITYVEYFWSMTYTVPGINKWLHRNGFTYKKPKCVPYKADKTKQKQVEFIQVYSELKATLNFVDSVYFGDSVYPNQANKLSDGWIKKGENKKVRSTANRTRLIIISALKLDDIGITVLDVIQLLMS